MPPSKFCAYWEVYVMPIFLYNNWKFSEVFINEIVILYIFYLHLRCSCFYDNLRCFFNVAPYIILIHLVICLLQYVDLFPNYHSFFTVGSTFGNPDVLASYLSMLLPACYMFNRKGIFRVVLLILSFVLFILLESRTAIVASLVTLLCYWMKNKRLKKTSILIGGGILLLVFLALIVWRPQSFMGRVYIWIVSLYMICLRPLGWGLFAFDKHYMEQQAKFTMDYPDVSSILNYDMVYSPYNEFLHIGVSLGVFALLIYVAFVLYLFKLLLRNSLALFYPFLTFQILSLSFFPFSVIPLVAIYMIICCCTVNLYAPKYFFYKMKVYMGKFVRIIAMVVISLLFVLNVYCFDKWRMAIRNINNWDKKEFVVSCYERIYPLLKNNGRFLVSFAEFRYQMDEKVLAYNLLHQAELYYTGISFLQNLALVYEDEGNVIKAKYLYDLASHMTPNNVEVVYRQVLFLRRYGFRDEAHQISLDLIEQLKKQDVSLSLRERFYMRKILENGDKELE